MNNSKSACRREVEAGCVDEADEELIRLGKQLTNALPELAMMLS